MGSIEYKSRRPLQKANRRRWRKVLDLQTHRAVVFRRALAVGNAILDRTDSQQSSFDHGRSLHSSPTREKGRECCELILLRSETAVSLPSPYEKDEAPDAALEKNTLSALPS